MQIMSAKDAKVHFGEMLDTMQREPVLLIFPRASRPVNAFRGESVCPSAILGVSV